MRIAIVTDSIEIGPTSVGNYTYNFIKYLLNLPETKDWKFFLIHGEKNNLDIYKNKKVKDIIIPFIVNTSTLIKLVNWRLQPAFIKIQNDIRNYFRMSKMFNLLLANNINVLHIPHLGRPAPSLFFLRHNLKLIVTNHGMANLALPNNLCWMNSPLFIKQLYSLEILFWKLLRKKITSLITVSNSEKDNIIIKKLNFPENKIRVIYHGVNHQKFKIYDKEHATTILYNKYNINSPFILHVSSYQPKKNLINILKAFNFLKKEFGIKHKLLVVGQQPNFIKKQAKKFENNKDIIFLGHITHTDLPLFYNLATCFVFPSLHESFGMPIIEAMACGCPVVTSNVFSCPEVAGDAALLVDPYNMQKIAEAIYLLLSDKKLRDELKRKSLARAKEFTWEKCAMQHYNVYSKI